MTAVLLGISMSLDGFVPGTGRHRLHFHLAVTCPPAEDHP